MFGSEDEIVRSLSVNAPGGCTAIPEAIARKIAALAKPSVWVEAQPVDSEMAIPIGATKIGGYPDLPEGNTWPYREPYPDAQRRAAWNLEQAAKPDSDWRWATAQQCEAFRRDFAQMAQAVSRSFPLQFVAQIDLAEIWAAGRVYAELPKAGLLSVFFDAAELPPGAIAADHVGTRVVLHAGDPTAFRRLAPPEELTALQRYLPIAPFTCSTGSTLTPLPPESRAFAKLDLPKTVVDRYLDWWMRVHDEAEEEGRAGFLHRIGGWPMAIQNDMPTELALSEAGYDLSDIRAYSARESAVVRASADAWVLLAQIGSDEKNGLMWGDNGMLYIWIRREDLAAGRLEKSRAIVQCH